MLCLTKSASIYDLDRSFAYYYYCCFLNLVLIPFVIFEVVFVCYNNLNHVGQLARFYLLHAMFFLNNVLKTLVTMTLIKKYYMHYYMQGSGFEPRTPHLFTL